ncbi:MAG: shikimate dehydrogenase [candidate division Zixibacteria bacterium]|nr:shikimate dehydrogenase [candidate division Zixibacteria bacterium]
MMAPQKFGLIGRNIAYSLSPAIFKLVFDIEQIEGEFDIVDVEPDLLETQIKSLASRGYQGLSVTVPYKQTVIDYADELDDRADAIGAVNSLALDSGRICAFNTDGYGFALPLEVHRPTLDQGAATLLGCGGSARAVAFCLAHDFGMKHLVVAGRSPKRLEAFKTTMLPSLSPTTIETISLDQLTEFVSGDGMPLVVNCTPLGGPNHAHETPLPEAFPWCCGDIYYDLNYNTDNCVLRSAHEAGMIVIDGREMLVGQAVRSFNLWTGLDVPFDSVYERMDFNG